MLLGPLLFYTVLATHMSIRWRPAEKTQNQHDRLYSSEEFTFTNESRRDGRVIKTLTGDLPSICDDIYNEDGPITFDLYDNDIWLASTTRNLSTLSRGNLCRVLSNVEVIYDINCQSPTDCQYTSAAIKVDTRTKRQMMPKRLGFVTSILPGKPEVLIPKNIDSVQKPEMKKPPSPYSRYVWYALLAFVLVRFLVNTDAK